MTQLGECFHAILTQFGDYKDNYISKINEADFQSLRRFVGFMVGFSNPKSFNISKIRKLNKENNELGRVNRSVSLQKEQSKFKKIKNRRQTSIDLKLKRSFFNIEKLKIQQLEAEILELKQKLKTIESNSKKREFKLIEKFVFEKTFSNSLKDISKNLEKKVKRYSGYLQKFLSQEEYTRVDQLEASQRKISSNPNPQKNEIFDEQIEEGLMSAQKGLGQQDLKQIRGQETKANTKSEKNKVQTVDFDGYQNDIKNYQDKIGNNNSQMQQLIAECSQMKHQMSHMFQKMTAEIHSNNNSKPQVDHQKDKEITRKEQRIRELERINLDLNKIVHSKNSDLKTLIEENLQVSKDLKENMFQEYVISQGEFEEEKRMKEEMISKYKTELSNKNMKMLDMASKIENSNSFVKQLKSNITQMKSLGIVDMMQMDDIMEGRQYRG